MTLEWRFMTSLMTLLISSTQQGRCPWPPTCLLALQSLPLNPPDSPLSLRMLLSTESKICLNQRNVHAGRCWLAYFFFPLASWSPLREGSGLRCMVLGRRCHWEESPPTVATESSKLLTSQLEGKVRGYRFNPGYDPGKQASVGRWWRTVVHKCTKIAV